MAVNDELIAINASHSIYVNRLAAGMGNRSQPFLDAIEEKINTRLAKETGRNLTAKRREALLKDIAEITTAELKAYTVILKSEHKEFGGVEGAFQAKSVNGLLINAETTAISASLANKTAKSNLIKLGGGSYTTYDGMMQKYWQNNSEQITNIVANGYSSGTSTREITNTVMNEVGIRLGKTKTASKSIATTGLNHYANMARKAYFEENDIVIGVRRIATIDSRTSQYCRGVDQTVVLKTDSNYSSAFPGFHPNCRTDAVPELDSRYTQDDDGGERATNFKVGDSLDPKPVDSQKVYYDELQKLKSGDQDRVLGPTLGKAFRKLLRNGGTPSQFAKLTIDPKLNKAYTITELKRQDNVLSEILNKQAK